MPSGFESIFDAFDSLLGGPFQRGGRDARDGAHLGLRLGITLEDSYHGVKKRIALKRHEGCAACKGQGTKSKSDVRRCSTCHGHGEVVQSSGFFQVVTACPACGGKGTILAHPCPDCRGDGRVRVQREIEVSIPAGVADGMQLRLTGEGDHGAPGGRPGDVIVEVEVAAHDLFARHGLDLLVGVPLGVATLALGGEVEVPTFEGIRELTIPPATSPGTALRLAGLGFPNLRARGVRGDLVCVARIEVPRPLSPAYEREVRSLAEIEARHPTPRRKEYLAALSAFAAEAGRKPVS
ncbi:MAG: molecular chaperone DnaJ [Planctomycetes bacterium]|nr:molecular chaperone DnaJ [Planctomycetota bacterium]